MSLNVQLTVSRCLSVDLIHSSKAAQTPGYESWWDEDCPVPSSTAPNGCTGTSSESTSGRGFFVETLSALTPRSPVVFMRLATTNHAMQSVDSADASRHGEVLSSLMYSRNAAQHSLLCLESWEQLDEKDQTSAHRTVYDACRLTALIYSNALLFAVPHHSGWHTALAGKLRMVLEYGERLDSWRTWMQATLLWCLMVGGIAAFQSSDREYFERSLCNLWRKMNRPSWKSADSMLNDYLCSSVACQHGAAVLWSVLCPHWQ